MTSNFDAWLQEFNQTRIKTNQTTNFLEWKLKWKFEPLPTIVSEPTLITYLEHSSNFHFNVFLVEQISRALTDLKFWYQESENAVRKYLNELEALKSIKSAYQSFLSNTYVILQDFINDALLPWIFENALGLAHKFGNLTYETNLYFQSQQELLVLKLQKQVQKIIKLLLRQNPQDQTFFLLNQAYDQNITSRIGEIKRLKAKALLERGFLNS